MIIKVLEAIYKTVPSDVEGELPQEVPSRFVSKRMEVIEITEYSELVNPRTKKPYKKRCLFRCMDQWLIVNHSFDELTQMKNTQSRIIIKGFYDTSARQGNRKVNRGRKK
jgi:hypothetical protein